MSLRPFLASIAVAALAGCGGGGGTPPNTPKGAVQGFIAAVKKGDWKAACARLEPSGLALQIKLHVDQRTETDDFGSLKDCPVSLARHAADARKVVAGADPGPLKYQREIQAVVGSPKGDWQLVDTLESRNKKVWQVSGFPGH
jgi:hypothetical protein